MNASKATFTCVAIIHIQFPPQPQWGTDCHLCHQSSCTEDSPLNPCRICPRVYHTKCLKSRGYLSEKIARDCLKLSTSPIGWSCFNCVSIGQGRCYSYKRVLIQKDLRVERFAYITCKKFRTILFRKKASENKNVRNF